MSSYCSAFGDTALEALQEVEIAKSLWLEVAHEKGFKIPEPKYRPAYLALLPRLPIQAVEPNALVASP
jgi:predicted RNase H-like HicB family nuclease